MKVAALITLSALVAATASAAPADPQASAPVFKIPNNGQGEIIPDQYIVRFKNDADHATLTSSFKKTIERENAQEGNTLKSELHHEFDALPEFKGVAGKFSKSLIEKLKKHDKVAEVIPDKKVYALGTQTSPPSWGIGRISRKSGIGAYVFPDTAGANVDVYVIDTGVYAAHRDFGGRARMAWKAHSSWPSNDDNGHGTHCAGTIGGATYGVAKRANIFGVKVLGGDGSGSNSGVIAGINFVAQQAKNKGRTIIASMSLGGGYDSATNSAVRSLYYAGAVVAVAAGNESQNACNVSPASESTAITVGATTRYDRFESSYSNYGSCVDILAPGTDITSTWNNGGSNTISGTSMATPHVAGAAALWLGVNTAQTNQQVRDGLLGWASQGIISGVPSGTPNRFLYTGDGQ